MKNIATKLLQIKHDIGTVNKGATNPFFSSKYVEINSLLEAINPILNKHGVLLTQPLTTVDGKPAIQTMLIDSGSGEFIEGTSVITEMKDAQKQGASVTYHRRYGVLSILGLGAQDDDGESLKSKAPVRKKVATKTQDIPF